MQPLGITSLGHIALRARDIEPLVDFYANTLGFTEMFRLHQDDGALMLVYLRITDDQYLELFPNGVGEGPAPREAVGLNHLCLTVADLDATVAALAERGVPLTRPLITGRDNNRQSLSADLDNICGLGKFLSLRRQGSGAEKFSGGKYMGRDLRRCRTHCPDIHWRDSPYGWHLCWRFNYCSDHGGQDSCTQCNSCSRLWLCIDGSVVSARRSKIW